MSHPFVKKVNEKNLCSWFVLPMIGISPAHFGDSNFIDSYLVQGKWEIAVHVADMQLCTQVLEYPEFSSVTIDDKGRDFLIFNIPQIWQDDCRLFIEGKYSKLSEEAKDSIRTFSGLKYKWPTDDGKEVTDALLRALDKDKALLDVWKEVIEFPDAFNPEELLSAPTEKSFITFN